MIIQRRSARGGSYLRYQNYSERCITLFGILECEIDLEVNHLHLESSRKDCIPGSLETKIS